MGWKAHQYRVSDMTHKPASISIKALKRGGLPVSRPSLIVSIRHKLANEAGWQKNEPVALLIGEGDHCGRIRIVRHGEPRVARVRSIIKGGMSFNLGYVEDLCSEERGKRFTDAQLIDENTIEVVLPDWTAKVPVDEDDEELSPTQAEMPPEVAREGIAIFFEHENERLVYGQHEVELTTRQAKVLAVLLQAMPETVEIGQLISAIWANQPPLAAGHVIEQIKHDLSEPLQVVGIDLRKVGKSYGLSIIGKAAAA